VIPQLHQVSLAGSLLTLEQSDSLFAALAKPESFRLRRLDISGLDLTLVPPNSLALALTKLEQVSLAESWLCQDQLKAIFRAMASTPQTPSSSSWSTPRTSSSSWSSPSSVSTRHGEKKLAVVNLHGVPLSFLDPSTFASAISQLEEVDLTETKLTRMQKRQICRILLKPSKVKKLWIDGFSFSCDNPNRNDNAENNANDNEANNNANINNAINDVNAANNVNANHYEPDQLGGRHNNHILAAGVA
jgi:hypothetical protein